MQKQILIFMRGNKFKVFLENSMCHCLGFFVATV